GLLRRAHVSNETLLDFRPIPLQEPIEEDVLRVHRDVGFEGSVPIAFGGLQREKAALRTVDRLPHRSREVGTCMPVLGRELTRFSDSPLHPALPAASPIRSGCETPRSPRREALRRRARRNQERAR